MTNAQKGHKGSNSYILAPRCGPLTVEGGLNGPYGLRDMMMMTNAHTLQCSYNIHDIKYRMAAV